MSAGSASADTGLGGTLDQVSSTVTKVVGGSSHASSAPRHSSGSKASAPRPATHSSPRVSVRSVVKPVVRPVARPVVHAVHRAAKPVVRVERARPQPAVKPAPAKATPVKASPVKTSPAEPVATKATRKVSAHTVSADLLRASVRPAAVAVQAGSATVSTTALADVTAAVLPSSLDLTAALPPLEVAVGAPSVDLVRVTVPEVAVEVGLPPVLAPVDLPGLPGLPVVPAPAALPASTADPASTTTAVLPSGSTSARGAAPASVAGLRVLSPVTALAASHADGAVLRPVAAAADAGLSLLAGLGAAGVGSGTVPDASAGAAGLGLVLLALLAVVGPTGLTALRPCPVPGHDGHLPRLLRQPGFAPD